MQNEDISSVEFANFAETRSKVYGFLSQIYLRPPDDSFVRRILEPNFHSFLTSLTSQTHTPQEMKEGLKTIENFLENSRNVQSTMLREKLSLEYTRLFRGIKRFYGPPPPYESVYLDEGRVMGEAAVKVAKEYTKAGVAIPQQYRGEPADHIGFELDFMRYLCHKESIAWESNKPADAIHLLKEQRRFLNEHMIRWIPSFCNRAATEAGEFYKGILKITKGFIQFEGDQLMPLIDTAEQVKS